jgi:hypothetical protein
VEGGLAFEDAGGGLWIDDEIDRFRRHLGEWSLGVEPRAMPCRAGRATMRW